MIEPQLRRLFPKYSPEVSLDIRNGRDTRFHETLLWEVSIGELSRYIVDFELFTRTAIKFLKFRGTIYSMRLALSWVGFESVTIFRLSNLSYEVDPGAPFSRLQEKAIVAACKEAAPARAVLKRIFHLSQSVSL